MTTLFSAGTMLIIIKAATLEQTIQISLSLHAATICYRATPRKVKEKRFYCIFTFYTILWVPYARHM